MTYRELYENALWDLEHSKITLGEFDERVKPLNQELKTGHWARQTDDYHDYYECEHCGIAVGLDDIKNYCPNCGYRMYEPQESEDKE